MAPWLPVRRCTASCLIEANPAAVDRDDFGLPLGSVRQAQTLFGCANEIGLCCGVLAGVRPFVFSGGCGKAVSDPWQPRLADFAVAA